MSRQAPLYAQVVLDIPARSLENTYSYLLPAPLAVQAEVGCSVLVDFAHRPALGYLLSLSVEPPAGVAPEKLKPVRELLSTPLFDAEAAELAFWLAGEYLAPLSDCIRLFMPPGGTARVKKDASGSWTMVHPQAGPVDDRWARLTPLGADYEPPATASKQRLLLAALKNGELRVADLALAVPQPQASLKALEKRGMVVLESRRRMRGSCTAQDRSTARRDLTPGQAAALEALRAAQPGEVLLLDGVTGSGKTEVYLQAISEAVAAGGSAIVLVPEISLTPQTVSRFRSRFGEDVAVLHSRLSTGERFDQWELVRTGQAHVVVGARSALFAPVHNLRLIVIDEEHESSYKQGSSPRYVSRDVARQRACISGAVVVLGSATPSLESLAAVEQQRCCCVVLPKRVSGRPLPPVEVVNLAAEFQAGNRSMYSAALKAALQTTIERGEKAVLLLNKRGFASFLLCRDCGYVPTCTNCDTSLTYHRAPPHLLCHYCSLHVPAPGTCPECGSPYLRQLGPGTQFAVDQLTEILPAGTPVVRMDADTTRLKGGHEQLLEEFAAASTGVLLGTQMIAKGLDFAEVTLVGVLIADTALKFPDFRAAERTWQLLEQVAGRAGRAEKDGQVIVQTYWPEHAAIQAAARHDREVLLASERAERAALGYPPYGRLANVLVWGTELDAVRAEVNQLAQELRPALPKGWQLLGPSPCVLARRQGAYRWHLLIKAPPHAAIAAWLAPLLKTHKQTKGVNLTADIDPQDLM